MVAAALTGAGTTWGGAAYAGTPDIIYESAGYAGLGAYDLTGASLGYHIGNVNNIWLDGGYVYFQQSSIYVAESGVFRANADLSDVTKVAALAGGSVDFAVWSTTAGGGPAVPEPATWTLMITGFGLAGARLRSPRRNRPSRPRRA